MPLRSAIAVAVSLFVSTHAMADPPRYKRTPQVPPTRAAPVRAPAVTHREPVRPTVTSNEILVGMERSQPLRVDQEAILVKLVAETPDSDPDKPEYEFRLAEHYASQLRFWRLKANAPSPR